MAERVTQAFTEVIVTGSAPNPRPAGTSSFWLVFHDAGFAPAPLRWFARRGNIVDATGAFGSWETPVINLGVTTAGVGDLRAVRAHRLNPDLFYVAFKETTNNRLYRWNGTTFTLVHTVVDNGAANVGINDIWIENAQTNVWFTHGPNNAIAGGGIAYQAAMGVYRATNGITFAQLAAQPPLLSGDQAGAFGIWVTDAGKAYCVHSHTVGAGTLMELLHSAVSPYTAWVSEGVLDIAPSNAFQAHYIQGQGLPFAGDAINLVHYFLLEAGEHEYYYYNPTPTLRGAPLKDVTDGGWGGAFGHVNPVTSPNTIPIVTLREVGAVSNGDRSTDGGITNVAMGNWPTLPPLNRRAGQAVHPTKAIAIGIDSGATSVPETRVTVDAGVNWALLDLYDRNYLSAEGIAWSAWQAAQNPAYVWYTGLLP